MSAFEAGEMVVANANVQGLRAGEEYEVRRVEERRLPFGYFVSYFVRAANAPESEELCVRNGHMLLARVPA